MWMALEAECFVRGDNFLHLSSQVFAKGTPNPCPFTGWRSVSPEPLLPLSCPRMLDRQRGSWSVNSCKDGDLQTPKSLYVTQLHYLKIFTLCVLDLKSWQFLSSIYWHKHQLTHLCYLQKKANTQIAVNVVFMFCYWISKLVGVFGKNSICLLKWNQRACFFEKMQPMGWCLNIDASTDGNP